MLVLLLALHNSFYDFIAFTHIAMPMPMSMPELIYGPSEPFPCLRLAKNGNMEKRRIQNSQTKGEATVNNEIRAAH